MKREEIIKKWLNEPLNSEEQQAFDKLEDSLFLEEIVNEATRFQLDVPSSETLFLRVNEKIESPKPTRSLQKWIQIGIAVAALFLVGIFIVQNTSNAAVTVTTQASESKQFFLPDNSSVQLNSLSEVRYDPSNWSKNRQVTLKGEAFFDVEKGSRFDVLTSQGTVSVLGTEFNIKVTNDVFEVVCYEGRVQVKGVSFEEILNAGQQLTINQNNPSVSSTYVLEPSWMNNMSVYQNAPLEIVFAGLEQQFEIAINATIQDKNRLFSGAFKHNNLNDALTAVTAPLNLVFEITSDKQVIIKDAP